MNDLSTILDTLTKKEPDIEALVGGSNEVKEIRNILLKELTDLPEDTPKANAIHTALIDITLSYPYNTECYFTLEPIDLNKSEDYIPLSNGMIFSKNEFKNWIAINGWIDPVLKSPLSEHDKKYLKTAHQINEPGPKTNPTHPTLLEFLQLRASIQSQRQHTEIPVLNRARPQRNQIAADHQSFFQRIRAFFHR